MGSVRFVNGEEMGEEVLVELKMDEKEVGEVIEWLGGAMVGDQTIRAFRESSRCVCRSYRFTFEEDKC